MHSYVRIKFKIAQGFLKKGTLLVKKTVQSNRLEKVE